MAGHLDPRLLDEEGQRMIVVLRRLEGFTRRRPPAPAAPARAEEPPRDVPHVNVAEFFRRCQWSK